ncbi:MAG: tRNA (guanosine(37)-N1)-methyltransferase TrmD [Bacteroidales bacterium]|nr:tRNA (guanosine(37)-N1)-methyltransferase TrmD [Bacteroidales bacterium]
MIFHILTLFPEMVAQGLNSSVIGKAAEKNLIGIHAVNIRDYTLDKHGKVDDYTYGGGAGMLLQAQPVFDAYQAVAGGRKCRTVYVTPQGVPFTQKLAMEFAKEEELIILCGHYEGVDERALEEIVTDYVSIGDYVLTGGELPAMVMVDAVSRLVPGVLGNDTSAETETFHNELLEYPQYSRPEEWHGKRVPEILLSGNHRKITQWRLEQSKERTKKRRPDLYAKYQEKQKLWKQLSQNKRSYIHMMESLVRGTGEIIRAEGFNILLYNRACRLCMMDAENGQEAEKMFPYVPEDTRLIVSSKAFLNEMLCRELSFQVYEECWQALYTRREPLPVKHKDIRLLSMEDKAYVAANYHDNEDYIVNRIGAKALYGAYVEDKLVGFVGIHNDGSTGILFVEPDYRGRGIGQALESYIINRQLEMGHTPYGHVIVGNENSVRVQEHLGLYLSKDTIWWLGRERQDGQS